MRRFVFLSPLLSLSCQGCEWFTDPKPRDDTTWFVTQPRYARAQPAISGDTLFVATGDGQLIARNKESGAQIWSSRIANGQIEGGNIVVAAGAVIVPVLFETRAVDATTGQQLWTYTAPLDTVAGGTSPGQVAKARIAALDSTVFIPAWGGTIAALDARTGALRWRWNPPQLPHRFGAQGVTVRDTTVYAIVWHNLNTFGTISEGRVLALDARTGAELWQTVLPNAETVVCVSGAPAVTSGMVVVTTINGRTYGLNRATGAVQWTLQQDAAPPDGANSSVITGAVASNDTIFADAGSGHVRAIAANSGTVLWRSRFGLGHVGQLDNEITLSPTRVYAPNGGHLYIYERSTGRLLRTRTPPGRESEQVFAASIATDAKLAYAAVNGAIWAFPH